MLRIPECMDAYLGSFWLECVTPLIKPSIFLCHGQTATVLPYLADAMCLCISIVDRSESGSFSWMKQNYTLNKIWVKLSADILKTKHQFVVFFLMNDEYNQTQRNTQFSLKGSKIKSNF